MYYNKFKNNNFNQNKDKKIIDRIKIKINFIIILNKTT
jgi:hypothetical protein